MFPPAVGSGVLGLASQGLSMIGQRKQQKRQNEANMKMAEYTYNKDLEMWNKANAYNTPEAQMQRIEDAGLNKNMIYGSGSVTGNSTGTLPKYTQPQQTVPKGIAQQIGETVPRMVNTFQDMAMKQVQMDNVKAQTQRTENENSNSDLERALLLAKANQMGVSTKLLTQKYGFNAQLNPFTLDLAKTQAMARKEGFRQSGIKFQEWLDDKPFRKEMQGYQTRSAKYKSLYDKYNYGQRGKISGSPILEFIQKALISAGVDPVNSAGQLLKKLIAHNNSNNPWKFDPFGWNEPKTKTRGAGGSWGTWKDGIPNN